ncbi:malonate--CoA ligase [Tistrella mobilis]|uniref:Malonyl-CoA synthase n=1 Tax=Tistrella mobilis (strain KA081020-065) TaxID=1110502 RepID=I3TJ41_TISMK|nr:malonyl-CoA synthase [Tistrella mobilis]AFK52779.1 malonyl-CoA synthase [Tistrella mobilis KA081020-065]
MSDNLYARIRARFPADPARPMLYRPDGSVLTYGDADRISGQVAALLDQMGVAPGDRVAVQVDKSPMALMLYLGCLRRGAVYLPLNTAYKPAELEYFIDDAEPRLVVCRPEAETAVRTMTNGRPIEVATLDATGDGAFADRVRATATVAEPVARSRDDLAAILYSSGTTGRPKGVMLSGENLWSNAETLVDAWGFTDRDVLLHMLPIFHTHGLFVATHCVLLSGAAMLFEPKFDAARALALMPRATVMMGVPTFYVRLLAEAGLTRDATAHMRLFVSGSAPLLPETFARFEAVTGHRILERYGMTETNMNTSNPYDGDRRQGTVGRPLPGVELRITGEDGSPVAAGEAGMIELKGPNVFKGYWRKPEKTAEDFTADGFFRSGDIGTIDGDGYVSIVGRAKDLVISGGFNVYPKEIELVIDRIPGVDESAVIGVPHPDFGEAVVAVVVREAGADAPDEAGVLAVTRDQLANFKQPKRVLFAAELPRNAMGKVQKNLLRDAHQGLFAG